MVGLHSLLPDKRRKSDNEPVPESEPLISNSDSKIGGFIQGTAIPVGNVKTVSTAEYYSIVAGVTFEALADSIVAKAKESVGGIVSSTVPYSKLNTTPKEADLATEAEKKDVEGWVLLPEKDEENKEDEETDFTIV